jgi:hypothetical protein
MATQAEISSLLKTARSMSRGRTAWTDADSQMLPDGLGGTYGDSSVLDVRLFRSAWKPTGKRTVFKRVHELAKENHFVNWVIYFKLLLFMNGFDVMGAKKENMPEYRRLTRDIFLEALTCDNAVVVWVEQPEEDEEAAALSRAIVMNCGDVRYDDSFGVPTLAVRFRKRQISESQKDKLGERYAKALAEGSELVLDESHGEHFVVLSNEKLGNGLGVPRLRSVFDELSALELAGKGDWNAFWTMKDVIRQVKKGHDIKTGNLAGMPMHFIKEKEARAILGGLRNKAGSFDAVTNFDVDIKYPTLEIDPKFLDAKKYGGVMQQLLQWAGPIGLLFKTEQGRALDDMIPILNAEMEHWREEVRIIVEQIINDPSYDPGMGEPAPNSADAASKPVDGSTAVKPPKGKAAASPEDADPDDPARLQVTFNPLTLATLKNVVALVTAGLTNGIMSPQTGRKRLGLVEAVENANMKVAAANKENYTPVFEAKQGLLQEPDNTNDNPENTGGRPADKQ